MHPLGNRIVKVTVWAVSLALSFICGAAFLHKFYVYADPITRVETVDYPRPHYVLEDFQRANAAVESFLADQKGDSNHRNLRPHFIATPTDMGYVVYYSSGRLGTDFPPELLKSVEQIFKKSLNQVKTSSRQTKTRAEQAATLQPLPAAQFR